MVERNPERLKSYLELITRKRGGIGATLEKFKAEPEALTAGHAEAVGLEGMAAAPAPAVDAALRGMEALERDRVPSPDEMIGLEAIINADLRPAADIVDGTFAFTHPLWKALSSNASTRARIEAVIPSVGRIELPGHPNIPFGGTGFVVGDGLIMTNRHVAAIFASGMGDRSLSFITGRKAGVDFLREQGRPTGPTLAVRRVVMIHPFWDMAILAVDGLPANRKPLRLSLKDARDLEGDDIFIIGYPAFDPRNPSGVQMDLFDGRFGVKRLQPGELHGGMETASFGKLVKAAIHDCSTLGGNSGSAVFDLATGDVIGLHFGGLFQQQNYCVPASELARDSRVIATGIGFAGTPPGGGHDWDDWWRRADDTEGVVVISGVPTRGPGAATATSASVGASAVVVGAGGVTIEVPLRITVSLGAPAAQAQARAEAVVEDLEGLREPEHDTDYQSRTGYDADFLGVPVPMPAPADATAVAPTRDGGDTLHYQNFSVMMHAKRRLALLTACNVTKEPKLRKPEAGRDYTRKGLSGLGPNDQERWFLDSRMESRFQIPDVFFTKDRKAFDKGHIVRRDDVAFGKSYAIVKRANGDSYHVTNCSPQVSGFNQSSDGVDNWGDLENHVLSEAASERLCVFAGPVLKKNDEMFFGVGEGGVKLRARIPARFWKVIVARVEDGIAAYGFVLEQDLDEVQFEEFAVAAEFVESMKTLAAIEKMTGVVFDPAVRAADQFETVRGAEIAMRAGARRKPG